MESGHATGLIQAIQAFRKVYEHENQHLSESERKKGWSKYWNDISAQAAGHSGLPAASPKIVPSKRPASMLDIGMEPASKRPGLDPLASVPCSHPLQRQNSAPAGRTVPLPSRATHQQPTASSETASPINIPQPYPRRVSAAASVPARSFHRTGLGDIDEVQVYSPADYLARSPEDYKTAAISATPSPAVEHGEFDSQTLTYNQAYESSSSSHTPMTATSDSSLASAPTVFSEPMTRTNTDDVLCSGFDMFRVNSSKPESDGAKADGADQVPLFSYSPDMVPDQYHDSFSDHHPPPFSYRSGSEMKPSLSSESDASYSSSQSPSSPRMQEAKSARLLAPKLESNDSSPAQSPPLKLVAVTAEDGTVTHKAEIARAARQEPPRKTMYCKFCNEQPNGFHGVHELDRHIDRQHTMRRKVWICKEATPGGIFLANCKACRARKTYGANYNAAAHLRRAHFNPPKNKRGGRGKKSEGRGGMGGGNKPSMEELKKWMYEEWEYNINGKIVSREMHVGEPIEPYSEAHYVPGSIDEFPVDYSLHQETMMMADMHPHPVSYAVMPTTVAGHHPMSAQYQTYMPPPVYSM